MIVQHFYLQLAVATCVLSVRRVIFYLKNKCCLTFLTYYFVLDKEGKDKDKDKNAALAVPRLSVCADAQKVDRAKLAQTEVNRTIMLFIDFLLRK